MYRLRTGIETLDTALGGGILPGLIHECYGDADGGKSTLSYHLIARCQAEGGLALLADFGHTFVSGYPEKIGVDLGELILTQPTGRDELKEVLYDLAPNLDLVVIDDAPVISRSKNQKYKDAINSKTITIAPLLPDLKRIAEEYGTTFILMNRIVTAYGVPELIAGTTTTLMRFVNHRILLSSKGPIKYGGTAIGKQMEAQLIKHPNASIVGQSFPYRIRFGAGIVPHGVPTYSY